MTNHTKEAVSMHQVQVRPPCSFPVVSFVIKKQLPRKSRQLFVVKLNEIPTINGCRTRRFVFRRCLGTIPNAQANE